MEIVVINAKKCKLVEQHMLTFLWKQIKSVYHMWCALGFIKFQLFTSPKKNTATRGIVHNAAVNQNIYKKHIALLFWIYQPNEMCNGENWGLRSRDRMLCDWMCKTCMQIYLRICWVWLCQAGCDWTLGSVDGQMCGPVASPKWWPEAGDRLAGGNRRNLPGGLASERWSEWKQILMQWSGDLQDIDF